MLTGSKVGCSKMFKVRWDKRSIIADYYRISGELLYNIPVSLSSYVAQQEIY